MEVTLTIEDNDGEQGSVSAYGADYDAALAAARALIPEGSKIIADPQGLTRTTMQAGFACDAVKHSIRVSP
jgi:hypothetical protein